MENAKQKRNQSVIIEPTFSGYQKQIQYFIQTIKPNNDPRTIQKIAMIYHLLQELWEQGA